MNRRHHWERHPGVRSGKQLSTGERAADVLKHWFGTWTVLGLVGAFVMFWLLWVHDPGEWHLNLVLSCMAAVQGIILQISANRSDRIAAELALHDHEILTELRRLARCMHANPETGPCRCLTDQKGTS